MNVKQDCRVGAARLKIAGPYLWKVLEEISQNSKACTVLSKETNAKMSHALHLARYGTQKSNRVNNIKYIP